MTEPSADVPFPKVPGEDAPEGFNRDEVISYTGYISKFMCQVERDSFDEEEVIKNEELREIARAVFNEQSQEDFLAGYSRLARYILDWLIGRGLLKKEESPDRNPTYWKTQKCKDLCPRILEFELPIIDRLVDDYDRDHSETSS
jgi:hypothetical protein